MAGKLSLAPRWIGRPLAGKNCLQITTRFRFLFYSALFFSSLKHKEHALKVKRNTWSIAAEKDFFLFCKEKAITDFVDKCVRSAGVSRPFKL